MKSLKKTLSLVLVLVMVLGMFGIASAAKFTDDATVQYKEAVDVMVGIGAIAGFPDGTFGPTKTITRAEAAKMVAYTVLGKSVAETLSSTTSSFSDVPNSPAYAWAIPSIEYLVKQGVIAGVGGGKFNPEGQVTALEVGKMLLCALGYGANDEYVGAGWDLQVAIDAAKYGIFAGRAATANALDKAASREEVALYCFNTLFLEDVVYSALFGSYQRQGTSLANPIGAAAAAAANRTTPGSELVPTVYPTLTMGPAFIDGVAGYFWSYKNSLITGFISGANVLATSADGTSLANLTNPTNSKYIKKLANDTSTTKIYLNDVDVTSSSSTAVSAIETVGVIVKFIDTNWDGKYEIVSVTEKTVAMLAAAPTTKTTGSVTTVTIGTGLTNINTDDITYPADLKKGDVILWYTGDGHTYVEKAEALTGTISSYTGGSANAGYVTISGKNYVVSGLSTTNISDITELKALIGEPGHTFYLDNGGNICYLVESENAGATAANTFFVAATDHSTSFGKTTFKAAVVKADGTQDIITVAKTATSAGTMTAPADDTDIVAPASFADGKLSAGLFYTYALNADGTYNLRSATNQSINATTKAAGAAGAIAADDYTFTVTGNKANFLNKITATDTHASWTSTASPAAPAAVAQAVPLATAGTVFLYHNASNNTYTALTGIANAQSYAAGGTIYVLADDVTGNYAQVVICTGATTSSSAAGYDQIFVTTPPTVTLDSNNTPMYAYQATVNGEVGKIITSYQDLTMGTLYFVKDYAANGAIMDGAALTIAQASAGVPYTGLSTGAPGSGTAAVVYAGGTLSITASTPGNASYLLNSSSAIFLCDATDLLAGNLYAAQITPEQAAGLTYDGTNDTIYVVPTNSSGTTAAAIYIFVD